MNTDEPAVVYNKARALADLFPQQVPKDFAATFDPRKYRLTINPNSLKTVEDFQSVRQMSKLEILETFGDPYLKETGDFYTSWNFHLNQK